MGQIRLLLWFWNLENGIETKKLLIAAPFVSMYFLNASFEFGDIFVLLMTLGWIA